MIKFANKLRQLTPPQRRLLFEATIMLAAASAMIAVRPFRQVAAMARLPNGEQAKPDQQASAVIAVRWAIGACARTVPWRAKCLEQAFAAQWMLSRRSVPAVIHYGMAKNGGGLEAHAWVRTAVHDVVGCENISKFNEIACFPKQNARSS